MTGEGFPAMDGRLGRKEPMSTEKALPAPVIVRVAVAYDSRGNWEIYGSNAEPDDELLDAVREQSQHLDSPRIEVVSLDLRNQPPPKRKWWQIRKGKQNDRDR
jgi:hypothetical protein